MPPPTTPDLMLQGMWGLEGPPKPSCPVWLCSFLISLSTTGGGREGACLVLAPQMLSHQPCWKGGFCGPKNALKKLLSGALQLHAWLCPFFSVSADVFALSQEEGNNKISESQICKG